MNKKTKPAIDLVEGDVFIVLGSKHKVMKQEGLLYIHPPLYIPLYLDSYVEMVVETPEDEDVSKIDEIQHALDRGFEPGRWWTANDKEGNILAQTSNPNDFKHLGLMGRDDVAIFRLYNRTESEWIKEMPKL